MSFGFVQPINQNAAIATRAVAPLKLAGVRAETAFDSL